MSVSVIILTEVAVIEAAKKWVAQRARYSRAAHLGKARSRAALYERAEALTQAVRDLEQAVSDAKGRKK